MYQISNITNALNFKKFKFKKKPAKHDVCWVQLAGGNRKMQVSNHELTKLMLMNGLQKVYLLKKYQASIRQSTEEK